MRFSKSFFNQPTLTVARRLLGAQLVTVIRGRESSGTIIEVEAYHQSEPASHSHRGVTSRNQVMFGPPGRAYVYFTYGNHWMLNAVTEEEGFPAAVLIRAIQPLEGIDVMMERRQGRDTLGPGKLTQALGITKSENYADLTEPASSLRIEAGFKVPNKCVTIGPRVGLNTTPEPWFSKPWRFLVKENIPDMR